MNYQQTVIDYLEGRITPQEFEELLVEQPGIYDWLQSLVPEGKTFQLVTFSNGKTSIKVVPYDIREVIYNFANNISFGSLKPSLGYYLNVFDIIERLVKEGKPDLEFKASTKVDDMWHLAFDACPECVGGPEVEAVIEGIVESIPDNLSKTKRIALAKAKIKEAFHLERKRPYWYQSPNWPACNGKPMKYVGSKTLNFDMHVLYFVDVETGEEREVIDCT